VTDVERVRPLTIWVLSTGKSANPAALWNSWSKP